MIAFVKGTIFEIEETSIIIENNSIGYRVYMPAPELLTFEIGIEVLIHTYMNVKEDALDLYGSTDKKTINLFKRLIEVSGVGPKIALGILSKIDTNDLISAIISGDANKLSTCPGIGKKTSERLVLELRDKLTKQIGETTLSTDNKDMSKNLIKSECFEALINLGYRKTDAKKIIEKVYKPGMTLEELVKMSLLK